MVQIEKLRRAYERLRNCKIHITDYRESIAFDAVFSLTTIDTYIAGIADRILSGLVVPSDHKALLSKTHLKSPTLWELEAGERFDLSPFPELLEWAKTIECVQNECVKLV